MTNKIYLSFNRLYTLKDGDYHGATLTYRIKHGDDLLAEGEIKGKSLSQIIRSIDIEEMEITKPLSVEYICTGNVEDVSASLTPAADRPFHVSDGYIIINDAAIREGWLSGCKKRFGDSELMPFGGFPGAKECQSRAAKPELPEIICTNSAPFSVTISWESSKNIHEGSKIQVQWVKDDYFLSTTDHKVSSEECHTITGLKAGEEIHCRLRVVSASGQKSEWSEFIKQAASSDAEAIIDKVLNTYAVSLRVGVNTDSKRTEEQRIKKLVIDNVTEQITKMLQPGGLLSRK